MFTLKNLAHKGLINISQVETKIRAIKWTSVHSSSVSSTAIHIKKKSQDIIQISVSRMLLKIAY